MRVSVIYDGNGSNIHWQQLFKILFDIVVKMTDAFWVVHTE